MIVVHHSLFLSVFFFFSSQLQCSTLNPDSSLVGSMFGWLLNKISLDNYVSQHSYRTDFEF